MSAGYFSPSWYRVASLQPRLKAHATLRPQTMRGTTWYVLQDPQTGRYHRLSATANLVASLMDGRRTVAEIWDIVGRRTGEEQPGQEEIIRLLSQLHAADLIQGDVPPDLEEATRRGERQAGHALLGRLRNPIAVKLPLLDPDRLLEATVPLVRPVFSTAGFVLWLAIVTVGIVLAVLHWDGLTAGLLDRVLAPSNLVLMGLVYPLTKALHELAHGWAVKRWGGHVREMGLMFLVFFPVPYVDASEAAGLAGKWQRAVVGAAGIMVELLLASFAMILWTMVEPGLVRAVAFNLILLAGVSTLLFNGNPLLRFDGYYVLADLLEIPNLATRANRYVLYLVKRYALDLASAVSPVTAAGERAWFLFYAVASFMYRLAVTMGVALFLATHAFFVGVALAGLSLVNVVVWPLAGAVRYLLSSPELRGRRSRALAVSGGGAALLVALVFATPLPHSTVADGVVWLPEQSVVRPAVMGTVAELLAGPGTEVAAGTPLLRLEDPELGAELRRLAAQRTQIATQLEAARVSDPVATDVLRQELERADRAIAEAREREAGLTVRAPTTGRWVAPHAQDLPGAYVHRGDVVGHVLPTGDPTVRVLVHQEDIDLVRRQTDRVQVRFAQRPDEVVTARLAREAPAAVDTLPSPALGPAGGGPWAEAPDAFGKPRLVEPAFQLDVIADASAAGGTVGAHATVRFTHPPQPIGWRFLRAARQLFLRQLEI